MLFKNFRAKHGGTGPFEAFYDAATGGQGLLGRKGLREERELTDQLISRVQGDDTFSGLAALAEAGRAPMTREEHANFRASLMQQALNANVIDEGLTQFGLQQARLRQNAVGKNDLEILDVYDSQASYASKLLRSADPSLQQQGGSLMASVLAGQREFATTNETQRIQLEESDKADRETIRGEFQDLVNQQFVAPMLQDTAMYASIVKQLEGGEGDQVASPALTTMVLDYAGASLRQSDDGDWGFSFGGLSIGDKAVPDMTYSQLRNQLNQARQGRDEYLRSELGRVAALAQRRGFGINGTQVGDLLFPLADAVYREREAESTPPPVTAETAEGAGARAAATIGNVATGFMRGTGATQVVSDWMSNIFGPRLSDAPAPAVPLRRSEETFGGVPVSPRGTARGVYVPRRLRRRPTND